MVRRKRPQRKFERLYTGVRLPDYTRGVCQNKSCNLHKNKKITHLGDGMCQKCYDRGLQIIDQKLEKVRRVKDD